MTHPTHQSEPFVHLIRFVYIRLDGICIYPLGHESIEKYSIQNAISYDYFGDKWMVFAEILKKMPLQLGDPAGFIASNRFVETSDSTRHYFLRIESFRTIGQVEPLEMAKDRISNILLNKNKADFISQFETELYDDAVKNEDVTFFKLPPSTKRKQ
jgi:hypothetical protein